MISGSTRRRARPTPRPRRSIILRQEARDRPILDKNGDEVGTVEELYVWEEPSTVHLIKVSGEEGSFLIPVHAVTSVDEDGVKLETAKAKVTDSPEYDSDEVPDDETRRLRLLRLPGPARPGRVAQRRDHPARYRRLACAKVRGPAETLRR